ncbi:MAG: MATE family efflux transporter [Christensenellaceae bacterium]|nr:MATE family efflux transporter [Christensenellaceae bacterium]
METKQLYLNNSPRKLFFKAAIPGAISMFAMSLYFVLDGIFVGQILGDISLAAINLGISFVMINFSLADLIGVGSSVPISIYLGMKEDEKANNVFTMACIMIFALSFVVGGLMYYFAPALLGLIGAQGKLASLAIQYIRVYALCSPVTTIVFAVDNFLRISGKIKLSMWLNVLLSLLTLLLEYTFLAVLKFDIWGAALASCIGMAIIAFIAFYPFVKGRLVLKFVKPVFTKFELFRIIKSGLPTFLSNMAGRFTSIAVNSAFLAFGGPIAVTAYCIVLYSGDLIQPLIYGVNDSLQPAIGYNWGAGRYDRVKVFAKHTFSTSAIIGLISAIVLFFFPEKIVSLFSKNNNADFLSMVTTGLKIYGGARLFFWFGFSTQSYMSAVEQPLYSGIISICMSFVFPMLGLMALRPLGLSGLWWNSMFVMFSTGIVSLILLLKFNKKAGKIVPPRVE